MDAFVIGYWIGAILLTAVVPALIGGLFRRAKEPSNTAVTAAWVIGGLLGALGIVNGDGAPYMFSLLALGVLTKMRYSAWRRRSQQFLSER